MDLTEIFGKDKNIVIGALHLPPSPGYEGFPGFDIAVENALADLQALEDGGADGVIFENNYDVPHTIAVSGAVRDAMLRVGRALQDRAHIPVGISVLWNDYRTALDIAKELNLPFVRVPVFVDHVKTDYGEVAGNPEEVVAYRTSIGAERVALFADIHVKHSTILSTFSIEESAKRAIVGGADALIVTGNWTGDAASLTDLERVRSAVGNFPILCGSGVDSTNVHDQFTLANGAIISTSLKEDTTGSHDVNLKPYEARLSAGKVAELIRAE